MDEVKGAAQRYWKYGLILLLTVLWLPSAGMTQDFTAKSVGSYGNIAVIEVTGNYDANNPDTSINAVPRQVIAKEFYKTHKDIYDFIVIFSNFDFAMPKPGALAFYHGVRNDIKGIGVPLFDNSSLYGSSGALQGTVDMGNTAMLVSDPLNPKFENSLGTLSHELMHRWSAFVKFRNDDDSPSTALLGEDLMHWSFLLDSQASVMYGNEWQDNGNGTFTSIGVKKKYSPLDLYLMGFIDKSQVPPMLLIESTDISPARMPELNATISGAARYVTIDDIIAAEGERIPSSADSQKTFKIAFILVTRPGTFSGDEVAGIEAMRTEWLKRYSVLTDGAGIIDVTLIPKDDPPQGGGHPDPIVVPRPIPANIEDGILWLMANQKAEGNWIDLARTAARDTTEVLLTLKNFPAAGTQYTRGVQWLTDTDCSVTDYLARKIEMLTLSGQDVSLLLADLVARQNIDGGWGSNRTYLSNPVDTALALGALSAAGYTDQNVIRAAIAFLQLRQNADGGWGNEDGGNIESTVHVLRAFNKFRQLYVLDNTMSAGLTFLTARQNADGGFGSSPSTVYDTALAVTALQDISGTSPGIQKAVNFILGLQSADGSWYGSAHQTAVAVHAVWSATITPDLSITPQDITFTPEAVTGLPAAITVQAKIANLGRTDVPAVKVELYDGTATETNKLAEQVVAFPGNSAVSVAFPVVVADGNAHKFYIAVDPENTVTESNKNNNVAANIIIPVTTYDFATLSSGISFSQNPADITKNVTISARISNTGTMNAYNVGVKYYIEDGSGKTDIATTRLDIPANSTVTSQVVWKTTRAGVELPVVVEVDPANAFAETSESNNKATAGLTVNGSTEPNLTVSYTDIAIEPTAIYEQGSVTVRATIRNEGFAPVTGATVSLYLGVPGVDGVLIGTQSVLSLNAGMSSQVSFPWQNISATGEKILYVRVDPDNLLTEITKDDNDAFTTVTILSLTDLAISANAITFNPQAPRDGDAVAVSINVKNLGGQPANNVNIRFADNGVVIGSQVIPLISGDGEASATVSLSTAGKPGGHEIVVAVDPDNVIIERSKDNNVASRTFGVQDANLWVTEKYISPNGDGVKDSADFFFRLSSAQTVRINILDERGETVRTFNDDTLTDAAGGHITWNGLGNEGMAVADGQYQITVVDASGNSLGSLTVTVDNNRSPLVKAIATKYLLQSNLTCMLPDLASWQWFPDESGLLVRLDITDPNVPEYPAGLYAVSADGQDILRLVPWEWSDQDPIYRYSMTGEISPDGNRILVVLNKWEKHDWYSTFVSNQLWVVDKDGRNLRLVDSYDQTASGVTRDAGWLPDSQHVAYSFNDGLWLIKSDGTGKKQIDPTAGAGLEHHRWSPDGQWIIYGMTALEAGETVYRLELLNTSGGKYVLNPGNDTGEYNFEWLNSEKILVTTHVNSGSDQRLWLVDVADTGHPVKLSDNVANLTLHPDRSKALYTEYSTAQAILKIVDTAGAVSTIYETRRYGASSSNAAGESNRVGVSKVMLEVMPGGTSAVQNLKGIWSPDGTKIALLDDVYELTDECHAVQHLVVIDLRTHTHQAYPSSTCVNICSEYGGGSYHAFGRSNNGTQGSVFSNPFTDRMRGQNLFARHQREKGMIGGYIACATVIDPGCANDAASGLQWLSDNVSLLVADDGELFAVNSHDGNKASVPASDEITLSPFGRFLTYEQYVDYSSVCYDRGYSDIWAISSLLNLTADLMVRKEKSAVILRGTATDLHFEGYQLQYADAKNPSVWNLIKPPSDVSVVNDVLTTWVPPGEGVFYVKLTVWDKAGNIQQDLKRVTWGLSASIGNIYKTHDLISPNGDGVKDTLELHYMVFEPVHLEFNIYDENNKLVRTYAKSHASTGEAYIVWDGRDENGQTVPDGKYRIQVFDYEFFVTVDNTVPGVDMGLSAVRQECQSNSENPLPESCSLKVDLNAMAYDLNLNNWIIEYGTGDNPQDWSEYLRGGDALAARDENGDISMPPASAIVSSFQDGDIACLIGKKIRLTASDFAANRRTTVSTYLEEKVVLWKWDEAYLIMSGGEDSNPQRWPLLPSSAVRAGIHNLGVLVTVRTPLVGVFVEYWNGRQWVESAAAATAANGYINIQWDNREVNPDEIRLIRLRVVDETGHEYYSNGFSVKPLLMLKTDCDGSAFAYNYLPQAPSLLRIQISSTDDADYVVPQDFALYDKARGDSVPEGKFQFFDPLLHGSRIKPGKHYVFKMLVTESGTNSLSYDPVTLSFPPQCMAMALQVDYPEAELCNALSGTADLYVVLTTKSVHDFITRYVSVEYYLGEADNRKRLGRVDLTDSSNTSIRIDTTLLAEGSHVVEVLLQYVDVNNDLQTIKARGQLLVDRSLPVASITYPAASAMVCPVRNTETGKEVLEIPIEGIAGDSAGLRDYVFYYGMGGNLEAPSIAKMSGIQNAPVQGRLGAWDITDLIGTDYNLKLEVVDPVGNKSCFTTNLIFDKRMDIAMGGDKQLFSPNGDGIFDVVTIHYDISEQAGVDVKVFPLLEQPDRTYILGETLVKTIAAGLTHLGGMEYAAWDGSTDAGSTAADGVYGIAVMATDSCGNVSIKWTAVRVDNTPPTLAIAYPRPSDVLGNVVEVKGTVDDLHLQSYVLEAGQGEEPQSFTIVASGSGAVQEIGELGKWNTYGLQGPWTLRLAARDTVGNTQTTAVAVNFDQRTSLIKEMDALPILFSPNGDGKFDAFTVRYEVTDACQIHIEIQDAVTLKTLKTYVAAVPSAGTYTLEWDGRNDAGALVPDGRYFVRLTASLAANTSVTQTETLTVAVDNTAPAIAIAQPLPDSYLKAGTLSIVGSVQDRNIKEYTAAYSGDSAGATVDRGNQSRENYIFGSLTDIPEGKYTLNISAQDQAGNEKDSSIIFWVDTTPPKVTLGVPASGEYFGADKNVINIAGVISEKNLDHYSLRYGSGDNPVEWINLQTGSSVPANPELLAWKVGREDGVADGVYTLSLYATDKAQWTGEARSRIVIDNTPPATSIASLKNGDYVRAPVEIAGTASDVNLEQYALEMSEGKCAGAYKWVALKKSSLSIVNSSLALWQAIPADGDYCIRLTATDKAGQKGQMNVQVKVDTLPPGSPLLSGKIENITAASLSWTKNTEPDLAGYNLFRDGKKVNSELLTAPVSLDAGLKDGNYVYTVRAVDFAGNESKPSNEVTLKIDLLPPSVRIGSPLTGARVGGLVDIKGTAFSTEDFKEYRLSIGRGAAPISWSVIRTSPVSEPYGSLGQWDTLGLADDVYTVKLEAEDLSGNVGSCQIPITLDNTPPPPTVLLTAAASGSDVSLAWQSSAASDLAGYLLYRNGQLANVAGVITGNLKPYLIAGTAFSDRALPDGNMKYDVVVMDEAGNISDLSNNLEVTIDTRPPHITITEPLHLAKFQNKIFLRGESPDLDIATVQFQFKKADETAWRALGSSVIKPPFITYLDPVALGLAHGDHHVRALATDKGGNTDPAPSSITLKYTDLAAPAAPADVKAVVTGGDVALTWTPNQEIDLNGYTIYRISAGGAKTKLNAAVVKDSTYQDCALANGNYFYEVIALDTYGNESDPSVRAAAKIFAPSLSQPYTPVGETTILLAGSNGGANNSIEVLIDPGTGPMLQGTATANTVGDFSVSALNLVPGENKITAVAKDAAGNTSKASEGVYVVYNEPPAVPAGFAVSVGDHDVQLTWNANTEADISGYNLYRNGTRVNASLPVTAGTATASSSAYSTPPGKAFDGDASTYWYTYSKTGPNSPAWLEIAFPSAELINRLELKWHSYTDAYGAESIYGGRNFEIQVWSGHAWITHDRLTGNAAGENVFAFSPSYRTDRIRIFVTDAHDPYNLGLVDVTISKGNLIAQNNHTDAGLADGSYSYRLTAVDYYGFESAPTEDTQAAVGDVIQPAAPLNLTAAASGSNVILSWDGGGEPDLAGYAVFRKQGALWIRLNPAAPSTANTYTDAGVPNGSHLYYVTAFDAVGNESLPSNEAQVNVFIDPPAPPLLSISVAEQGRALNATWICCDPPPAGYQLYRGMSSGGPYARVNDALIGVTNFIDGHVVNGTAYYYVVTAVDAAGNESSYSNEVMGVPRNSEAPLQSLICYPTISAFPATLYQGTTDIAGFAEPGATVELFNNGKSLGSVAAGDQTLLRTMPLEKAETISISPDGRMMIYYQEGKLWLKDLISGEVQKIIDTFSRTAWAPDSLSFAFAGGNYRLYLFDLRTGTERELNADSGIGYEEDDLSWSFDQKSVALLRGLNSNWDAWVKNLQSGELKQVTDEGCVYRAKLSPDGKRIAYFIGSDLYVARVDTLERIMIDTDTDGITVSWSPDGKMIAYVSQRDIPNAVVVADAWTGQSIKAIAATGLAAGPVWSPDGIRAAFVQGNKSGYSLAEASLNSEQVTVLSTNISRYDCGLEWLRSGDLVYLDKGQVVNVSPSGKFIFKDSALDAGENALYVIAGDTYGNQGTPSETITLTFNTEGSPDLAMTADDIVVYPPSPKPGEKVSIYLSPRNIGQSGAENIKVAVYMMTNNQWDLLKMENIPSLAAGASQPIELEWIPAGASGRNTLAVVLDPENLILEVSEDNNMASRDIMVMEQNGVDMTTTLDAVQYGADQNVAIGVRVRNSGASRNATLLVAIEDVNGGIVDELPSEDFSLNYGSAKDVRIVWNTAAILEGQYNVHSVLRDDQSLIAENVVSFKIMPDLKVEPVTLTTDKAIYHSREQVEIDASLTNAGKNVIIEELTADVKITDAAGNVLFSNERKIAGLMAGASATIKSLWNTAASVPGEYGVTLRVFVKDNLVATRNIRVRIESTDMISGALTAVPALVVYGNDVRFDYSVKNTGNTERTDLHLKLSVMDPDSQSPLHSAETILDLPLDAEKTGSFTISTQGYKPKSYSAVLQSLHQGNARKIADASFVVRDGLPPVISHLSPIAGTVCKSAIDIAVTVVDDLSGVARVEYQMDAGEWKYLPVADAATGRYSVVWNPVKADESAHTISFRAVDQALNTSIPVSTNIIINLTPVKAPVIQSPVNESTVATDTINITGVSEPGYAVNMEFQGSTSMVQADVTNGTFTFAGIHLNPGSNEFKFFTKDQAGNASDRIPCTLVYLPVRKVLTTEKTSYSINENVNVTAAITNISAQYPINDLTAKLSLIGSGGQTILTDEQSIGSLPPGTSVDMKKVWNTTLSSKGSYSIQLQLYYGGVLLCSDKIMFEILGTSLTGDGLTGTITALPALVFTGSNEAICYSISNEGNEDVVSASVKTLVLNSIQTQVAEFVDQQTIAASGTVAGSNNLATAMMSPGVYSAVLVISSPFLPTPKKLAIAEFEVKEGLQITKTINPATANLLVWVNDRCRRGFSSHHDGCPEGRSDRKCVRLDLLEAIMKEAESNYHVVYDRDHFVRAMRNPFYSDFVILGDHEPLTDHHAVELREQIFAGKGLISSLYVKDRLREGDINDSIFGCTYRGHLPGSVHEVSVPAGSLFDQATLRANGDAIRVEAEKPENVQAWIKWRIRFKGHPSPDESPAIIANAYGLGKAVFFAFDYSASLTDDNYTPLAMLLKRSITYAHNSVAPDIYSSQKYVPIRISLKNLSEAVDLRLTEIYPENIDIYDPATGQWVIDRPWVFDMSLPKGESRNINYFAFTPALTGVYALHTDVQANENGNYHSYKSFSVNVNVKDIAANLESDIINALNALQPTSAIDKKLIRNVVSQIKTVQARKVNSQHDVEKNIMDIVSAIERLIDIRTIDVANVRLMMDELLQTWEAKDQMY